MKRNNIIFFTGENHIFLKKELDKWIEVFCNKHGEFNVSRINSNNITQINIESELTTPPFLSLHRLIVLEDFPLEQSSKNIDSPKEKKDDDLILNILDKIPDNNFVIFIQQNPDKRKSLYKKLSEIATIKEYKILSEHDLKIYIRERLLGIDNNALDKLIELKNSDMTKIESEINKLSLFRSHGRISIEDIEKYITPEIEVTIFVFIDNLFDLNYQKALENLSKTLENSKIEPLFAGLMTNIRKYLFTIHLLNSGIVESQIIDLLKIHPFVFQKIKNKLKNYKTILSIYNELIEIENRSKIGGLIGDGENAIKIALEKVILDLKK